MITIKTNGEKMKNGKQCTIFEIDEHYKIHNIQLNVIRNGTYNNLIAAQCLCIALRLSFKLSVWNYSISV